MGALLTLIWALLSGNPYSFQNNSLGTPFRKKIDSSARGIDSARERSEGTLTARVTGGKYDVEVPKAAQISIPIRYKVHFI